MKELLLEIIALVCMLCMLAGCVAPAVSSDTGAGASGRENAPAAGTSQPVPFSKIKRKGSRGRLKK